MNITVEQIKDYLARYRPLDETNKRAIEHICAELNMPIKFENVDKCLPTLSFYKFKSWIHKEGLFQFGDVIVINDEESIVIVKKATTEYIITEAILHKDGDLEHQQRQIPYCQYSFPKFQDLIILQRAINKKNLGWSGKLKKLVPKLELPKKNTQVRVTLVGRRLGVGVFKSINENGDIFMYCVKMDNEDKIRYSLNEMIGNIKDYQLDPILPRERKELADLLSSKNLFWNGYYRRLENLTYKTFLIPYFFIDNCFNINESNDIKSKEAKIRHQRSNYFKTSQEAEEIIKILRDNTKINKYKISRVVKGQCYFYINSFFKIIKQKEILSHYDFMRFKNKNYFEKEFQAEIILTQIQQKRQEQLLNF